MFGVLVPHLPWNERVEWVEAALNSGADSVWLGDADDPLLAVAGLSQLMPNGRFGVFSSALADRPAVLAAKQLVTVDHLSRGRIEIGVDDAASFGPVDEALKQGFEPPPVQAHIPTWFAQDGHSRRLRIVDRAEGSDIDEWKHEKSALVVVRNLASF